MNNAFDQQCSLGVSLILYSNSKPADPNLWDSNSNPISIFGIIKKSVDNVKNIIVSLNYMVSFINKKDIKNNRKINLLYLKDFGQAV